MNGDVAANITHPPGSRARAVVMGGSAGAVEALTVILPALPESFPLPVMVVVHLPAETKSALAELFNRQCRLAVREAEDKEPICNGTVYFAPADYHLLVEADFRLSLSSEEPVLYSRPSIDVLFETAADAFGEGLIGIVLTGANSDGARGLKAVMDAGGIGLVQRPDLSRASAMPQAALDACPGAAVRTLQQIVAYLEEFVPR